MNNVFFSKVIVIVIIIKNFVNDKLDGGVTAPNILAQ